MDIRRGVDDAMEYVTNGPRYIWSGGSLFSSTVSKSPKYTSVHFSFANIQIHTEFGWASPEDEPSQTSVFHCICECI